MDSFKSYSLKVVAAWLVVTGMAWAAINHVAQASPPTASRIFTNQLGDFECGSTSIAGRQCIYCYPLSKLSTPSLSCEWSHS